MPNDCLEFKSRTDITNKHYFSFKLGPHSQFRLAMVGINTHLEQSIEEGFLDVNQLWLAKYIKAKPVENGVAEITAFFRIARRNEILNQQFIDSNMHLYQLNSDGRATHLVQKVVYGAEFIVSVKRNIRLNTGTRNDIENNIFQATREFFDKAVKSNWTAIDPPAQLANVSCSIMSSLQDGQVATLRQAAECLRDATKSIEDTKWRPVEIVLVHIPSQLETRLQLETIKLKKRGVYLDFSWISSKMRILSNHPTLQKIPPFKNIVNHFTILVKSFGRKLDEFHAHHVAASTVTDVVIREQQTFKNLLSMAMTWLIHLNKEVDCLHPILNSTRLPIIDIAEVKVRPFPKNVEQVKVFVLKVDYNEDQVMESLHKFIDDSSSLNFKRPYFSLVALAGEDYVREMSAKLTKFEAESSPNTSYLIGLVPLSSPLDNGAVNVLFTSAYKKKALLLKSAIPSLPPPLMPIFPSEPSGEPMQSPPNKKIRSTGGADF